MLIVKLTYSRKQKKEGFFDHYYKLSYRYMTPSHSVSFLEVDLDTTEPKSETEKLRR